VVERDAVIAEYWGTKKAVLGWMETHWPQLPRKFVPRVYTPLRRERKPGKDKGIRSKKLSSIAAIGR
jgi:hypothetical protein